MSDHFQLLYFTTVFFLISVGHKYIYVFAFRYIAL